MTQNLCKDWKENPNAFKEAINSKWAKEDYTNHACFLCIHFETCFPGVVRASIHTFQSRQGE